MPILNYTTKIDPTRTVGEIQTILAKAGVTAVSIEYRQTQPVAVVFTLDVAGQPVNFRLPSRWQGVQKRLQEDGVTKRLQSEEQAIRVAWRIVKDWVEAQLAIVEAGVAEMPEVFLPYAVNPQSGKTLYQEFEGNYLPAPKRG